MDTPLFLFPSFLVRDYEKLNELCPHLRLPKRYLISYLVTFIIWYFLAAILSYKIFVFVGIFLWVYVSYNLFLFARIWNLLGLSVPRLLTLMGVIVIPLDVFTSGLLRTAIVDYFTRI